MRISICVGYILGAVISALTGSSWDIAITSITTTVMLFVLHKVIP